MFKILLTQCNNIKDLVNPGIGIFNLDFIPIQWTGEQKDNKYVYDPRMAVNMLSSKASDGGLGLVNPVILEVEHIDYNTSAGRKALSQLLEITEHCTKHCAKLGFTKLWPFKALKLQSLDGKAAAGMAAMPYKQNQYKEPDVLKQIQFITAWAHISSESWSRWEAILTAYYNVASKYHKPVYADIGLTYHPSWKEMANKALEPSKLSKALQRVYALGYDGAVLNNHGTDLGTKYYEAITSSLNRINR